MRIFSTGKMMRRKRRERSIREKYHLQLDIIMGCHRVVIEYSLIQLMGKLAIHSKQGRSSIISFLLIILQV
jgi:hypothetical protein